MKTKILRLIALVIVLVAVILPAVPVFAMSDPESITMNSVRVFQNVWDSGDQLWIVDYSINYDTLPTEAPSAAFYIGIWDGVTYTDVHRTADSYGRFFTSFYLDSGDALTWDYGYTVKVLGSTTYFPVITEGVNQASVVISSDNYVDGTLNGTTPEYLQIWLTNLADNIGTEREEVWLDEESYPQQLSTLGTAVFNKEIPQLGMVLPYFYTISNSIDTLNPNPVSAKTEETSLLTNKGARLTNALNGLGGYFGIPGWMMGIIGFAILYFILAGAVFTATGSPTIAIAAGMPFILVGTFMGVIPLTFTLILTVMVAFMFGLGFLLPRIG